MSEFKVKIWRRKRPILGNPTRIKNLEHDEVSLEARDADSALKMAIDAEYASGGRALRVYVRVELPDGRSQGLGDFALMDQAIKEEFGDTFLGQTDS